MKQDIRYEKNRSKNKLLFLILTCARNNSRARELAHTHPTLKQGILNYRAQCIILLFYKCMSYGA